MFKLSMLFTSIATFVTPELLNEVLSIVTQIILLLWTLISLLKKKKPIEEVNVVFDNITDKLDNVKSKINKNGEKLS